MKIIPHKTYRCIFCGLRLAGSKFIEHAKEHASPLPQVGGDGH